MTPERLSELMADRVAPRVIDVRDPEKYGAGHLPDAKNIPLAELEGRLEELPSDGAVLVC